MKVGSFIKEFYNRVLLPVRKRFVKRHAPSAAPPAVDERFLQRGSPIQLTADGTGVLFHRRYWVDVRGSELSTEKLMALIKLDINRFVPKDLAVFERMTAGNGSMAPGDEFDVRITGPWNGPIKVVCVETHRLVFATLVGHMEAGEIQFRIADHPTDRGSFRFEIASWARSKDKLVDLAYAKLGVAMQAQQTMWTYFCEKIVETSEGERIGAVQVVTEEIPFRGEAIPVRPDAIR